MWTHLGYTITDMVHVYAAADPAGYEDPRRCDVLDWSRTELPPAAVAELIVRHDVDSEAARDAIWVDVGWAPEDLPAWRGLPWCDEPHQSLFRERCGAKVALAYAQHGYQPGAAAAWAAGAEIPGHAEALHAAGYTPETLSELWRGAAR